MSTSAAVNTTLQTPIEIQMIPEVPAPNANVLLQTQNVAGKDTALYTWTVNGRVVEQGAGRDRITITAGAIGVRTTVSVSVSMSGGAVETRTRTILPGELDLVWEGNTYTPPFYLGKPLATGDSTVTIAAFPNLVVSGARVGASSLVYQWFVNNSQTPYRSGRGLSSITLSPPLFNSPFSVRAVASTQDGTVAVQQSVVIAPQEPEILFYEKHPLLGTLFNVSLVNPFQLLEDEVTFRIFPLFVVDPTKTLYSWEVAGDAVTADNSGRELTLRKTGAGSGNFLIDTSLETPNSLYERASARARIIF